MRKILCRDSDPEWEKLRVRYLTGTGLAAMLGKSPWETADSYIESKLNPKPFRVTQNMYHGRFDEEHNMRKFSWMTGVRTKNVNFFVANSDLPECASTIDGIAMIPEKRVDLDPDLTKGTWREEMFDSFDMDAVGRFGLIEMKQTEVWYGRKSWIQAAEPPEHYWYQVQMQLHVSAYRWAMLVARVGAAGMRGFFIERDDSPEFRDEFDYARDLFRAEVLDKLPSV